MLFDMRIQSESSGPLGDWTVVVRRIETWVSRLGPRSLRKVTITIHWNVQVPGRAGEVAGFPKTLSWRWEVDILASGKKEMSHGIASARRAHAPRYVV